MPSANPFNGNGSPVWLLWTGILQTALFILPALWSVFLYLRHERRVRLRSPHETPPAQTTEVLGGGEEPKRAA